jgi:iron complex outermembrane recepter protein
MQSTSQILKTDRNSEHTRGRVHESLIDIVGSGALVIGLAVGLNGPARAQTSGSSDQLTEIVVTAEKREERLQDTPISVTAISGADLLAQGISDTEDAAREIPGVSLQSAGPAQTEYTIRGLSSAGPAVSTVGFYLDDVPMTAPSGAQNGHVVIDPDLYDLNRIEVLRGPQGTLYGSGSMGGTIKLVTNQPDPNKFDASAKVDGSDTQGGGFNRGINAMVNLPLIEGILALRIVGTDEYTSGWIDRIVGSNFPLPTNPGSQCASFSGCSRGNVLASPASAVYHNVNDEELKGTRASLRYQPTDQLSLTASAFYQTISQNGLSYFDSPPGTEAHYQPFNVPEPFSDTFRLYNLVGEYKLPAFTITSVSSYWTRSQAQTQDISETVQSLFDLPSFYQADGGIGPEAITEQDHTKQFSQEVRLASAGDNTFQWLVGAFYSDYDYGQQQYSYAAGLVPLFGSSNLFTGTAAANQKQTAEFGEASYKFTDHLKATVGLRHYSYTQDGDSTDIGIVYGTFTPVPVYVTASNSGFNPKFTLSYDIVDDIMMYGTAAKGFRPGAGNGPLPTTGADSCLPALEALGKTQSPSQYDPDTVWSFELGEKATLLDKRLTVDAAVYNERWSKVQQGVELSCGDGYIDNVGTASIWGGEIEVNAKLSSSWTLSQSGGYTHAVLTSTEPGTGVTPGERLFNVPDYTASTSIVYSHPIADYTLVARASNVLVGSSETESFFLTTLPGYDIVRARIGLEAAKWSAFLFVDNLTNKQAFLSYTHDYAENIPSLNRVATNQPRTVGLTLQFHY